MKKTLSLLKILFIGLILSIGFRYVFAVARPTTPPSGDVVVIDTGDKNDYIQGKFKVGGNWLTSTDQGYAGEQGYQLVVSGAISATGLNLTRDGSSQSVTPTGGNLYVQGSITTNLTGTTTANICAGTDGKLKRC